MNIFNMINDLTQSESETSITKNDTFYAAESIYTPSESSTVTLNGNISTVSDIDIYYIDNSYGKFPVDLTVKLINGTATCALWTSSLKDTNITSNPDTFLVSKGAINAVGTKITFTNTSPFLYMKCTNSVAGIYSVNFVLEKEANKTSSSLNSILPLVSLICSGAKDSCIRDCTTGSDSK